MARPRLGVRPWGHRRAASPAPASGSAAGSCGPRPPGRSQPMGERRGVRRRARRGGGSSLPHVRSDASQPPARLSRAARALRPFPAPLPSVRPSVPAPQQTGWQPDRAPSSVLLAPPGPAPQASPQQVPRLQAPAQRRLCEHLTSPDLTHLHRAENAPDPEATLSSCPSL